MLWLSGTRVEPDISLTLPSTASIRAALLGVEGSAVTQRRKHHYPARQRRAGCLPMAAAATSNCPRYGLICSRAGLIRYRLEQRSARVGPGRTRDWPAPSRDCTVDQYPSQERPLARSTAAAIRPGSDRLHQPLTVSTSSPVPALRGRRSECAALDRVL